MSLYAGVMSGTSGDGIDVAVVDFADDQMVCLALAHVPYPKVVRNVILQLIQQPTMSLQAFSRLDAQLGHLYAQAIQKVLADHELATAAIQAIGVHGQTVFHEPEHEWANTLQIGSAAIVAQLTGLPTASNFRQMDLAWGGQGAPLAPLFHQAMFADPKQSVAVINLGGIANITWLNRGQILGFDTGPANCLMDDWIGKHQQMYCDEGGQWAQQGQLNDELLQALLSDGYFAQQPPKSTGREYFNLAWLAAHVQHLTIKPVDVQRTLLQLTVETVAGGLAQVTDHVDRILVCGGGVHNHLLMTELSKRLQLPLCSTSEHGLDADYVEAAMMAWLAKQRMEGQPLDYRSVTGASSKTFYGVIHRP